MPASRESPLPGQPGFQLVLTAGTVCRGTWLKSATGGSCTEPYVSRLNQLFGAKTLYCPNCTSENRERARFCDECGVRLPSHHAVFDRHGSLDRTVESARSQSPSSEIIREPERRRLTMMFCDVVESTALAECLDPEELREVMGAYQSASVGMVIQFGGFVANYLGDGVLAYFGYPQAHEDDPQRAVKAGLSIVSKLPHLNAELQRKLGVIRERPLQVRISVHTGLVVTAEIESGTIAAVGETPNIAARLQTIARPNSLVISAATYKLVKGFFDCRSLGIQTFKGISSTFEVYQVVEDSGAQSRFEVVARSGLTPLVARDEELTLLLKFWESIKKGESWVVQLSGEPGIGKSRLMRELGQTAVRDGCTYIQFRCSPYYQNTAFYPVIDYLQRLLQLRREDSATEKLQKLERKLTEYSLSVAETLPLLATLLSLPYSERYSRPSLSPQRQKQKTQEALVTWLLSEAERNPVLTAWEDLHWADPSTLELLRLFLNDSSTARILTLLIFRPEFSPTALAHSHIAQITLTRLAREEAEMMLSKMMGGKPMPQEVIREIVAKTDGVPLFLEELTKMVLESGLVAEKENRYELTRPVTSLAIPDTLYDSLMARLDQFPATRKVAQLAATLGREFRGDLLQAVSELDESVLRRDLARLSDAGLLHERGAFPQAVYVFKHALIQEIAYQSLLRSTRYQYHQRIAQVLEQQFPDTAESEPEMLARHYTEAELNQQAVSYWQRAGQQAVERSANLEAIAHFTKGLRLLQGIPESVERDQQEVLLQVGLGMTLMFAKGYSAPDVQTAYARARELCSKIGETPQLYPVLWGLWAYYLVRSEYQDSHDIGSHLLTLAEQQHDNELLLEAHTSQGLNYFHGGCDLPRARMHLDKAISLYDSEKHFSHGPMYGQDPGVVSLGVLSWTLWLQGYPEQALVKHERCLDLARHQSHNHSIAWAFGYGASFRQFRREIEAGKRLAEQGIAFSNERGFHLWSLAATYTLGWALNHLGQSEAAVVVLRDAVDKWKNTGARITRPHQLGLLADALGALNRAEEGIALIDEALDELHDTGEQYYKAELHRLKGELLLRPTIADEAGACDAFFESLQIARSQGAKAWELRTAISLVRLRRRQGKSHEAYHILANIYSQFTEGFDTPDLRDARGLLAERLPQTSNGAIHDDNSEMGTRVPE